jgi:hypothetical protein
MLIISSSLGPDELLFEIKEELLCLSARQYCYDIKDTHLGGHSAFGSGVCAIGDMKYSSSLFTGTPVSEFLLLGLGRQLVELTPLFPVNQPGRIALAQVLRHGLQLCLQ